MKKTLTTPMIILTLLAGILHGYHQHKAEKKSKALSLPRGNPTRNPVEPSQPNQISQPAQPTTGPVNPPKVEFSMKKVHQLFNQAEARFQEMEYPGAAKFLQEALDLLAQRGKAVGDQMKFQDPEENKFYEMMDRMWKRCLVYYSLVQNITPIRKDELNEVWLLEFPKGGKVLALRFREFQEKITFSTLLVLNPKELPASIKENEQIFLPSSEVSGRTKMSLQEYEKLGTQWIRDQIPQIPAEDFMAFYRLIYFCTKNRLFDSVSPLLTKALRSKNGILLLEAFASHPLYDINMLKYFWLYSEGMTRSSLAGTNVAYQPKNNHSSTNTPKQPNQPVQPTQPAQPSQPENPDPEGEKEKAVVKVAPDLQKLMDNARSIFQEGMDAYRKVHLYQNSSGRQQYVKLALAKFREAYDLYSKVSQKEPNLAGLQETIYQLNTLIYDCQKLLNF